MYSLVVLAVSSIFILVYILRHGKLGTLNIKIHLNYIYMLVCVGKESNYVIMLVFNIMKYELRLNVMLQHYIINIIM